MFWRGLIRQLLAALMAVALLLPPATLPVNAEVGDRTLYLYHTHTHETARITFKRNGVYDKQGLQQLDWFLRDWRNNQPTTMSPQLFDLIWEIYQKTGATQPINIVSAYRSPVTNGYLHTHSAGVANNSQHMLGHAMDIFIPGVPLARLRQIAMRQQVGGVGFYPTSGSPFVHVDVGTVRAWPRMTEAQLKTLFPDGKTLHVPSDGRILSNAGRQYAMQQWNACHAVPCSNAAALKGGPAAMGAASMVEVADTSMTGKTFADIHRGINPGNPRITNPGDYNDDESTDDQESAGPEQTAVATVAVAAPLPMRRPPGLLPVRKTAAVDDQPVAVAAAGALFPDAYPAGSREPVSSRPAPTDAISAIASLDAPVPLARLAGRRDAASADVALAAYAPVTRNPVAESQLQRIINDETTGAVSMASLGGTTLTNSVGSPLGAEALRTYAAARRNDGVALVPAVASFALRDRSLGRPDFTIAMVQPVALSSTGFADFVQPSAIDLSPATELGPMVTRTGFHAGQATRLGTASFAPSGSLLVASR